MPIEKERKPIKVYLTKEQIEIVDACVGVLGEDRSNVMEMFLILYYTKDLKDIFVERTKKRLKM